MVGREYRKGTMGGQGGLTRIGIRSQGVVDHLHALLARLIPRAPIAAPEGDAVRLVRSRCTVEAFSAFWCGYCWGGFACCRCRRRGRGDRGFGQLRGGRGGLGFRRFGLRGGRGGDGRGWGGESGSWRRRRRVISAESSRSRRAERTEGAVALSRPGGTDVGFPLANEVLGEVSDILAGVLSKLVDCDSYLGLLERENGFSGLGCPCRKSEPRGAYTNEFFGDDDVGF